MATTVLEMPDTPQDPATPAAPETPPVAGDAPPEQQPTPETPETPAPVVPAPPEAVIEVDGEKLTASQIKTLREKYERDSKWIQANEAKAAELNRQEEEVRQTRALKGLIEQRPDILEQLLKPPPERNFDAEMQSLYAQRPDPTDYQNYANWELAKDKLNREATAAMFESKARSDYEQRMAIEHNNQTEKYGKEKYLETKILTPQEFHRMNQWIIENAKAVNNRYPKEANDIAFKALYEDKFLAGVKLTATQRAIPPAEPVK